MTITKEYLNSIKLTPILESLKLEKIDDATYFSKKYNGYISNSRLSLINPEQDNDPKAFFEGLGKHNIYSDSLVHGSAVHQLILQPEYFNLCMTVDRPTAKAGHIADLCYKPDYEPTDEDLIQAAIKVDYYNGLLSQNKLDTLREKCTDYWKDRCKFEKSNKDSREPIYLDSKGREKIIQCVNALKRNVAIHNLLHPSGLVDIPISENEQAILLDVKVEIPDYEPFIFRLKSKLDNYTIDKESNVLVVNDVKTLGKMVNEFQSNFDKYHYYRELAMYSWLLTLVAKKYYNMEKCILRSNCLVVSTIPNYYTSVYKLTKADFTRGWNEFRFLIRLAAHYYKEGYRFE